MSERAKEQQSVKELKREPGALARPRGKGPSAPTQTRRRGGDPIRVVVAEDDAVFREALTDLIRGDDTLELAGEARDAQQAIDLVRDQTPDVAIVDVRMPAGGGRRAARGIRLCSPRTKVVALSAYGDRGAVMEMLGAGAAGYLVKGTVAGEIIETIHRIVQGQAILSEEVTTEVVSELGEHLERRQRAVQERASKLRRIKKALEPGALKMVFQPIFDLEDGSHAGFESLARFELEPARSPQVWFEEAAEVGLLVELEVAAIRAALGHLDRIAANAYLSVNISPQTALSPTFRGALQGIDVSRTMIEVTEHAPIEDYVTLEQALADLRRKGMRLAIDDAGAGYSGLQHILRLNPDVIKLDLSLTRGIDGDPRRRALAAALIAFATEIDAVIVAEGIETSAELDALRALGVSCGQGYHLSRPGDLPSEDQEELS